MSSERINQVEYNLNNNSNDNYSLQFNLLTGRLLFNTSIINLFRNQYNLKLNLIYNSKTNFNPNMDSHLGLFFKFDISEYITKTDSLVYFIDSLDRYHLAKTIYKENSLNYRRLDCENDLIMIIDNNDDSKIIIKDNNGNIKEFTRLANQSYLTYYYVLTKKIIKFSNNTIIYHYVYDSENRLTSIYNNKDVNRRILFNYNDLGFITQIYNAYTLNNETVLNGIKIIYDNSFQIIAIKEIVNSISDFSLLFIYANNKIKYLINNKTKFIYDFTFDISSKLTYLSKGSCTYNLQGENDNYVSEYIYTSNIDLYLSNNSSFEIQNLIINPVSNIIVTYNNPYCYTIIEEVNPLNSNFSNKYIYYMNNYGELVSNFEVLNNNLNTLKDLSIVKGIELLGDSGDNNQIQINNKYSYQYMSSNTLILDSDNLNEFKSYHNSNITKFNISSLPYNIECFISLSSLRIDNFINIVIIYVDQEEETQKLLFNYKQTVGIQKISKSFFIKNKAISNISFKIETNNLCTFTISNMYISLGKQSYLMIGDSENGYSLNRLSKVKYALDENTLEEGMIIKELGDGFFMNEYDLYTSFKNLIIESNKTGLSHPKFILSMNNGLYQFMVYRPFIYFKTDTYDYLIENYFEDEIEIDIYFQFKTLVIDYYTNDIKHIDYLANTSAYSSNPNYLYYVKREYKVESIYNETYIDENNRVVRENIDNIVKTIEYDNYDRIINQNTYVSSILKEQINNQYTESSFTQNDTFNYSKILYDSFGLPTTIGHKTIYDSNYKNIYYKYDKKNNLNNLTESNSYNNHVNFIRYNNLNSPFELFNKNNSGVIVNHFFKYDNLNRITDYYRINLLKLDSTILPVFSYIYDDTNNTVSEVVRLNANNDLNTYTFIYDKKNKLIQKKIMVMRKYYINMIVLQKT